jgi:hypothetical protein
LSVTCRVSAVLLLLLSPAALHAQISVGLRVGAVASTNLARDSIVTTVTARQNVAPLVALRVELPFRGTVRLAGEVGVSRSNVMSRSAANATVVTGLTIWHPTIAVRVPATSWLTGEARLGALMYAPGQKTGTLFSAGAPIKPSLGLGVAAARPLGRSWGLAVVLQYDVHKFGTAALRAHGFREQSVVHRLALLVALSRSVNHANANR